MKSTPKPPEHPPIPLKSLFSIPPCNTNNSTMTNEGPEPSNLTTQHHHLLDWLEESITFLPSFLDDPYAIPDEITGDEWWSPDLDQSNLIQTPAVSATPADHTTASTDSPPQPQPELSKKRKLPANPNPAHHQQRRITVKTADENNGEHGVEGEVQRKPLNGRKAQGKGNGGGSGNGGSKDVRWAEQLLNPCAVAIDAGNVSRVQHLLYVLHELASPSGDGNHRLAAHGLRVLTHHLSSAGAGAGIGIPAAPAAPSFPSTEPRLFRSALIRFNEVSPWFAFPNSLANSSILQAAAPDPNQRPRALHVVDVGVSHGVQWPTLLEALTRRNGGAPSLVRLTVAGSAAPPAPFSAPPPGYDFPTHLLRYARSIDLNLQIDRANTLEARALSVTSDETLVVCIQFRAHHLGQGGGGGDADSFLRSVRELGPDLVVLSEIDGVTGGGFAAGFGRRAELLWRFLDSTSAAFKGRDCVERRVLEGEAARMLEEELTAVEGRERLRERMIGAGFREEAFGEEAVDAGRALLRKYDGNWEMRAAAAAEAEAAVGLWWKGQPVSFCSLWKPIKKAAGGQHSP